MKGSSDKDAIAVAEHLLKVTGDALMTGDVARMCDAFELPHTIRMIGEKISVDNTEDLRRIFAKMSAHYKSLGVTELVRICEQAEFVGPDEIRTTHVTHAMARGMRMMDPYPVVSRLVRRDGVWRVGSTLYDLPPNSGVAKAFRWGRRDDACPPPPLPPVSARPRRANDLTAMEIYQTNLDAVSTAVLDGPVELALDHLNAPYFMRTRSGLMAFNNAQDILDTVQSTHLSLKVQGATHYVRLASHAFFRSKTEIEGLHTTQILRDGEALSPPFENRMKLRRGEDGKWKVVHAEHSMEHEDWPMVPHDCGHGKLADVEPLSQADEIALMVYQEFLDALTASNLTHNFGRWEELCSFPHRVVIDQVTRIIDIPEDIRPFFDMVSGLVRDNPDATFKRNGEFATFVNSHTIRGYHRTTFDGGDGPAVFDPVRGRYTIELIDGRWRMTEVVNAIANPDFPYRTPIVSEALGSELDQHKDLKK